VGYVTDYSGGEIFCFHLVKSLFFSASAFNVAADNFFRIWTKECPVVKVL
jgi:hypothetical protein